MDIQASGLGAITSFAVWAIKHFFNTTTAGSYIAAAVVSIVLGITYSLVSGKSWVESLANVFISSQVVYALVVSELQAK